MELKARCKERFEPVVQAIRQLQKEKEGLDEPVCSLFLPCLFQH